MDPMTSPIHAFGIPPAPLSEAGGKATLRTRMLTLRREVSATDRTVKSRAIQTALTAHPLWREAQRIALYAATEFEPATQELLDRALQQGKRLALPRIEGPGLQFHWAENTGGLVPGPLGILQPKDSASTAPIEEIDLWIVPGLAFDRRGGRLGHGKGYYDKVLAKVTAPKVGLAFEFQWLESVPMEPHDIRLDAVVTELGWREILGGGHRRNRVESSDPGRL